MWPAVLVPIPGIALVGLFPIGSETNCECFFDVPTLDEAPPLLTAPPLCNVPPLLDPPPLFDVPPLLDPPPLFDVPPLLDPPPLFDVPPLLDPPPLFDVPPLDPLGILLKNISQCKMNISIIISSTSTSTSDNGSNNYWPPDSPLTQGSCGHIQQRDGPFMRITILSIEHILL